MMKSNIHAMILVSNNQETNRRHGQKLAEEATPHKEDIYIVEKDGLSIRDKAIEELLERLSYKPLIGYMNVAIIDDADTLTPRAQNRLLKTLEEPPGRVLIILLSTNEEKLLPTIRSRCVIYKLDEETGQKEVSQKTQKTAENLLAGKAYYFHTEIIKEVSEERDTALEFLNELKWALKEKLVLGEDYVKAHKIVGIIEEAEKEIQRHINQSYAVKNAIIRILEENS